MSIYNFFKNLFNVPNKSEYDRHESNRHEGQDSRNMFYSPNDDDDMWRRENDSDINHFNMFTDPLEMHRYFEHQMNEMIKSFGWDSNSFFGFNPNVGDIAPESNIPSIEPPQSDNLRDRFLKPGYENKDDPMVHRIDKDLDGRTINAGDLDELLKEKPPTVGVVTPFQHMPQIRSFGQSISSKTIRNPDGTIETHKTVRDSKGNEETVVTRQMGDKQYTIIIRTDKEGKQEKVEDMINMDEKELTKFNDYWKNGNNNNNNNNNPGEDLHTLFPYFDKFFK